jgi:sRNA-binding regulator protein Hfq
METTTYAYWSYKQFNNIYQINKNRGRKTKVNIYLVRKNGIEKEARITEIMKYKEVSPHAERFSDSIYLGEVVRWIRIEDP